MTMINYSAFLNENRTEEANMEKVRIMFHALKDKMQEMGLKGKVNAKYYTDGNIKVELNGEYYNIFNSNKKEFFNGFVGEYR